MPTSSGPSSSSEPSSGTRREPAIVVTGRGAVSAWGWGVDALWDGLLSGQPAIGEPARFDTSRQRTDLASEVPPAPDELPARRAPQWRDASAADRYALAAADEAWRDAGLEDPAARRDDGGEAPVIGVFFGGSTAAMPEAEVFYSQLVGTTAGRPRIRGLATHPLDGPSDVVARHLDVDGPVVSFSSACASGGLAVGAALDALRSGECDIAVAGGSDALCQLTYAGFNSLRAVDRDLCRPFRAERAGLNLGEGAGVLVLERLDDARARGARPRTRVLGHGASCDAHHMTAPHPEGEGAARAIRAALDDADCSPHEVTFVNAHGTGTPHNDRAEASALAAVFGRRGAPGEVPGTSDGTPDEPVTSTLPVTSTKGAVGHFLGSSGAIEAVVTSLCLEHGLVHPTPGDALADPDLGVDLVLGEPRRVPSGAAVSTSYAFGGSNAAVLLADCAFDGGSAS